jgi:hypothetical protein
VSHSYNSDRNIVIKWKDLTGKEQEKKLVYGESVSFQTKDTFVAAGGHSSMSQGYSNIKYIRVSNYSDGCLGYAITPTAEKCSIDFH